MSRRDFFQLFCMFYLRLINRKCTKEKIQQYLMLYQTWNRTSVYFKLAVIASYYFIKSLLEFKGTSTEHSGEGLSKKLWHPPTAWPWPSLVEIVQGVLGRNRLRALCAQTETRIMRSWQQSAWPFLLFMAIISRNIVLLLHQENCQFRYIELSWGHS